MTNDQPFGLFQAMYTTRILRRFRPDPIPDALSQLVDAQRTEVKEA
ncbi:MAG: hypothetical protein WEB04_10780 [Dehalococcoidia bacterium]